MDLRIGSVIQRLRKLKGLTQEQLADSIGFQRQQYQSGKVEFPKQKDIKK